MNLADMFGGNTMKAFFKDKRKTVLGIISVLVALVIVTGGFFTFAYFSASTKQNVGEIKFGKIELENMSSQLTISGDDILPYALINKNADGTAKPIEISKADDSLSCYVRVRINYSSNKSLSSNNEKYLEALNAYCYSSYEGSDYKWVYKDRSYYLTDLNGKLIEVGDSSKTYRLMDVLRLPSLTSYSMEQGNAYNIGSVVSVADNVSIDGSGIGELTVSVIAEALQVAHMEDYVKEILGKDTLSNEDVINGVKIIMDDEMPNSHKVVIWQDVSFKTQNGSILQGAKRIPLAIVDKGSTVTLKQSSDIDTYAGYTFGGWMLNGNTYTSATYKADEDAHFTAIWTYAPTPVQITLNYNGGNGSLSKIEGTYGGVYSNLPTPTKAGYIFTGWYINSACTIMIGETITKDKDFTIYAGYRPVNIRLVYNKNAESVGGAMDDVALKFGSSYTIQNAGFSRVGYNFKGWTTEGKSDVVFNLNLSESTISLDESTLSTINMVRSTGSGTEVVSVWKAITDYTLSGKGKEDFVINLYAVWDLHSVVVTFEYNDGTESKTTKLCVIGDAYGTLPSAERAGYTFGGWFTDNSFSASSEVIASTIVTNKSNHTLYAKWIANSKATYSVQYKCGNQIIKSATYEGVSGSIVNAVIEDIEGYTYSNLDNGNVLSGEVKENGSLVLVVNYKANVYTIQYASENGTIYTKANTTFKLGDVVTLLSIDELVANDKSFEKIGYEFVGFKYNDTIIANTITVTLDLIKSLGLSTLIKDDSVVVSIVLIASYSANKFTLNYISDGTILKTFSVAYGSAIPTIDTPSKIGNTFISWYKDENLTQLFDYQTMPNSNVNAYAKWDRKTYNVLYDAGEGKGTMSMSSFTFGEMQKLKKNEFTKVGYSFANWEIGGKVFYDEGEITIRENDVNYTISRQNNATVIVNVAKIENIVFVAKYTANTYKVTVELDNGTEDKQYSGKIGETLTINLPTKQSYSFIGWKLTGTGSLDAYIATEGKTTFTYTFGSTDDTITAQWEKSFTNVTFVYANGDKVSYSLKCGVEYGDNLLEVKDTPNGIFAGWFYSEIESVDFDTATLITKTSIVSLKDHYLFALMLLPYNISGSSVTGYLSSILNVNEFANGAVVQNELIEIPSYVHKFKSTNYYYECESGKTNAVKITSIGANAFKANTKIKSVSLTTDITSVGSYAFGDCTNLSTVYTKGGNVTEGTFVLSTATTLSANSFRNTAIVNIVGNANLVLSDYVFYGTKKLNNVDFANCIFSIIPAYAFAQSTIEHMTINAKVTTINASAFEGSNLNAINAENVQKISSNAFNNTKLTTLKLSKITTIEANAFSNNAVLETVEIANSAISIGENIFANCVGLRNLSIPYVGNNASSAYAFVYLFKGTTTSASESVSNNITALFSATYATSLKGKLNLTITKAVANYAFYDCDFIGSVKINGVTTIGTGAFKENDVLTSVDFETAISTIGANAFENCVSLTKIDLTNVTNIGASSFKGNAKLVQIEFANVKTIGANAFENCVGLVEADLNEITSLGASAFKDCTNLNVIIFKSSTAPTTVGSNVLDNTLIATADGYVLVPYTSYNAYATKFTAYKSKVVGYYDLQKEGTLPSLNGDNNTLWYESALDCIKARNYHKHTEIVSAGRYFTKYESIGDLLPFKGVLSGGNITITEYVPSAVPNTSNQVTIPSTAYLKDGFLYTVTSGGNAVTQIAENAYKNNTTMQRIIIPAFITSIGASAFDGCSKLQQITFEAKSTTYDSNITLGSNVFMNCVNLTTVKLSNRITSIPTYAFANDSSLAYLNIVDTITNLGGSAFYGCTGLEELHIEKEEVITITATTFNQSMIAFKKGYITVGATIYGCYVSSSTNGNFNAYVSQILARTDLSSLPTLNKGTTTANNVAVLWSLNKDMSGDKVPSGTANANMSRYYSNGEVASFTVTFEYNNATGGNTTKTKSVSYNGTYGTLPTPTKTGCTFVGWYKQSSFDTVVTASTVVTVLGNHTLYAKWDVTKYTITYNLNGGSLGSNMVTVFTVDDLPFSIANPTKVGYRFNGWSGTDITGTTADLKVTTPSNKSYTANYSIINYTITYNLDGGSLPINTSNKTSYYVTTETFTLVNPYKIGYTFLGWTGYNGTYPQTEVQIRKGSVGNRTYKANWSVISYTITYNLNGGTVSTANPTTYNVSSSNITLNASTKPGYTFTGWTEAVTNFYYMKGFLNLSTGVPEYSSTYPDSVYASQMLMKTNVTYTFSNLPNQARLRYYKLDGTYLDSAYLATGSLTFKPSQDVYGKFMDYLSSTDTARAKITVTSTTIASVLIPTGSSGNRTYVAQYKPNNYIVDLNDNGGNGSYIVTSTQQTKTATDISIDDVKFVGYIQSNNKSAYIDTGYAWKSENTESYLDAMIMKNGSAETLYGSETHISASSSERQFSGLGYGSNGTFGFYIGKSAAISTGYEIGVKKRFTLNIKTTSDLNFSIMHNGLQVNASTYTGSVQNGGNIYLFANNNYNTSSSVNQIQSSLRVYAFKLYDNGVLVRDMKPAVKGGVAGLYDIVEGKFYSSMTNEGFTYGSISFVEYLQNVNGASTINTEYEWTSEIVKVEMEAQVTSNPSSQSLFGSEERVSSSTTTRNFAFVPHGANGAYSVYVGAGSNGGILLGLNNKFSLTLETITGKKYNAVINGTKVYDGKDYTQTVITDGDQRTNRGKIYIFSNHNQDNSGSDPIQNISGMRLYSFKMYDNGTMVRNFVPCVVDGVAGLYDLVGYKFYEDFTGTAFTYGNSTTVTYDTAFEVKSPTRDGYTFAGWKVTSGLTASTAKWGTTSNPSTAITADSTVCVNSSNPTASVYFKNLNPSSNAKVILTAQWKANNYTITFNKNGGSGGSDTASATYGSAMPTITAPTKSGYSFGGYLDGYITDGISSWYDGQYNDGLTSVSTAATTIWKDLAGGNNLTLTNFSGDYWTGKSLKFDGTDDYAVATLLNEIGENATWEVTFKESTTQSAFLIDQRENGVGYQPIYLNGTKFQFYDSENGPYMEAGFEANGVQTLTIVKNGTSIIAYLNAEQKNTETTAVTVAKTGRFTIGARYSHESFFNGEIYSIRFYDKALTASEVLTNYTKDMQRFGTAGENLNMYYNASAQSAKTYDKTSNSTLYAYWKPNNYTVTYNYDNATAGNTETSKTVTYNGLYGTLPSPTKKGHTFIGWTDATLIQVRQEDWSTTSNQSTITMTYSTDTIENFANVPYLRITGATSDTRVDTYWRMTANNAISVTAGKTYTLSLYMRAPAGAAVTQSLDGGTVTNFNSYIIMSNGSKVAIQDRDFINDGRWHRVSVNFTVPSGCTTAQISIAADNPDIYGSGSYLDIANMKLEEGSSPKNANNIITAYSKVKIPSNHTLNASWTANRYKVSLVPLDNATPTVITVTYGSAMPTVTKPTRTGYSFGGYFTAQNGVGTKYYNADMTSAKLWDLETDTTLYAKWTANIYTVKLNGFKYPNKLTDNVAGFENTGWSSGTYNQEHVRSGDYSLKVTGTTSTVEVYAYLSAGSTSIGLTADTKNHIFYVSLYAYQEVNTGGRVQIYWPEEEPLFGSADLGTAGQWNRYSYYGNRASNNLSSNRFRIDYDNISKANSIWFDDIVIYDLTEIFGAGNEPTKAQVDASYEQNYATISVTYDQAYGSVLSTNLTKTGFTFNGWYTGERGAGNKVTATSKLGSNSESMNHTALTCNLYAKWTGDTYTVTFVQNVRSGYPKVTFNLNGASGSIATQHLTSGVTLTYPSIPTRSGYTFAGWYKESGCTNLFSFTTQVTDDVTVYAKWISTSTMPTYSGYASTMGGTVVGTSSFNHAFTFTSTKTMYWYAYVPLVSGTLTAYSSSSIDTYGHLYNASGSQLTSNDDGGSGNNFNYTYSVTAGTLYWVGCRQYSSASGAVTVYISNSAAAKPSAGASGKYFCYESTVQSSGSKSVTVSFNLNGASGSVASQTLTSTSSKLTYPTKPTRSGYYFAGWYKESACTNRFDFSENVANSITLYAKWVSTSVSVPSTSYTTGSTYRLTYSNVSSSYSRSLSMSGTKIYWFGFVPLESGTITAYSTCSSTDTSKNDVYGHLYNEKGSQIASNDDGNSNRQFKITQYVEGGTYLWLGVRGYNSSTSCSITVYISYASDTGSDTPKAGGTIDNTYKLQIQLGTQYGTLPNIDSQYEKYGYTLNGWNAYSNGNGTVITATSYAGENGEQLNTTNKTYKLYPSYTPASMTVTFNYGDATGGNTTASKVVYYDQQYGILPNPTKVGYTFDGWYKESSFTNQVTATTVVTSISNHTLYAKLSIADYKIVYHTIGSDTLGTGLITWNTAFGDKLAYGDVAGYTFGGWFTGQNGTGTQITSTTTLNTSLTAINHTTHTLDLYGKYTAKTYTVAYNVNTGTGSMANTTHVYGTASNLRTNTFTKTENDFLGWSTTASGSTQYMDGQAITNIALQNISSSLGIDSSATFTLSATSVPVVAVKAGMNLTAGQQYFVYFEYMCASGTNTLDVDLYPDTLPQRNYLNVNTQWQKAWFPILSTSSDLSSCQLRFFNDITVPSPSVITIKNVKMYTYNDNVTLYAVWKPPTITLQVTNATSYYNINGSLYSRSSSQYYKCSYCNGYSTSSSSSTGCSSHSHSYSRYTYECTECGRWASTCYHDSSYSKKVDCSTCGGTGTVNGDHDWGCINDDESAWVEECSYCGAWAENWNYPSGGCSGNPTTCSSCNGKGYSYETVTESEDYATRNVYKCSTCSGTSYSSSGTGCYHSRSLSGYQYSRQFGNGTSTIYTTATSYSTGYYWHTTYGALKIGDTFTYTDGLVYKVTAISGTTLTARRQ